MMNLNENGHGHGQDAKAHDNVELAAADGELIATAMAAVRGAQEALGAEYERHLGVVATLKQQIEERRSAYAVLVDLLAQKYVKRPGKYDFRPDLGAFVARKEQE